MFNTYAVSILATLLAVSTTSAAVKIVAHRGASADAPENTLAAFEQAFKQNADAIEGDFYITRDNQIICIHDADTKRTTGVPGKVAQMTMNDLRQLDAGKWKGVEGQKLPTFDEVVATIPAGKQFFIEIKCGPEIVPALQKSLQNSNLKTDQVVFISFNEAAIAAAKKAMPHYKAQLLYAFKKNKEGAWNRTPDELIAVAKKLNVDGLDLGTGPEAMQLINEDLAQKIRAANLEFHVWTVNDPALAKKLAALGVLSITTDKPTLIRSALP
jgi:glycerophosphoryl diester phosphodiesterase